MDYRVFGRRHLLAASVLALVLSGCGSVEMRSAEPINIIDNNFVESNDTEVVYMETPAQTYAFGEYHAA